MRLGSVTYFIPLFFVFNSALILQGTLLEGLFFLLLCLLGVLFLAGGLEGYLVMVGNIGWVVRFFLIIAGLLIAFPELYTSFIGGALALPVLVMMLIRKRKKAAFAEAEYGQIS